MRGRAGKYADKRAQKVLPLSHVEPRKYEPPLKWEPKKLWPYPLQFVAWVDNIIDFQYTSIATFFKGRGNIIQLIENPNLISSALTNMTKLDTANVYNPPWSTIY